MVRPRAIPWIAGMVAGLSAIFVSPGPRTPAFNIVPPLSVEIQLATICRLDGLFIGALCACFFRTPSSCYESTNGSHGLRAWVLARSSSPSPAMLFFPRARGLLLYGPLPPFPLSRRRDTSLSAVRRVYPAGSGIRRIGSPRRLYTKTKKP